MRLIHNNNHAVCYPIDLDSVIYVFPSAYNSNYSIIFQTSHKQIQWNGFKNKAERDERLQQILDYVDAIDISNVVKL